MEQESRAGITQAEPAGEIVCELGMRMDEREGHKRKLSRGHQPDRARLSLGLGESKGHMNTDVLDRARALICTSAGYFAS